MGRERSNRIKKRKDDFLPPFIFSAMQTGLKRTCNPRDLSVNQKGIQLFLGNDAGRVCRIKGIERDAAIGRILDDLL